MSENLSHIAWVAEQFKPTYLKSTYRNVFIHSSIIEGVLVDDSGIKHFDKANKHLLLRKRVSSTEFCQFNAIRGIRNKLAHTIIKDKLIQNEIKVLLQDLMREIHDVYKTSSYLDQKLFKKYNLERTLIITPDTDREVE